MNSIFITGIGTDVGKTVVSAIVTEALRAAYWKPVQAGFAQGTDSQWVAAQLSYPATIIPETYKLTLPASPHIAAREEGVTIDLDHITAQFRTISGPEFLVIEGAGGLMVPLNDREFILDLILKLGIPVLLVSRNYLGSINHSLLTAAHCKSRGVNTAGWIFNDQYLHYESEIADWSGIPALGSIPFTEKPDRNFIQAQAAILRPALLKVFSNPA